jgi:hypothetical protein
MFLVTISHTIKLESGWTFILNETKDFQAANDEGLAGSDAAVSSG